MTRTIKTFAAVAALALSVAAPAFANSQLIASAGLTSEQAEGLTLNQIAAAKYNKHRSHSDRQALVIERGGPNPGLTAFAVTIANSGESYSDRQIARPSGVAVSRRSMAPATRTQLIASAGLSPEQAEGLNLNQIVAVKYNRHRSPADRQKVDF